MVSISLIIMMSLNTNDEDNKTEKRAIRKQQYIDGLQRLFLYLDLFINNHVDIYLVDNTIKNDSDFDQELYSICDGVNYQLSCVNDSTYANTVYANTIYADVYTNTVYAKPTFNLVLFSDNKFGARNKGAGLVQNWIHLKEYIPKWSTYSHIIHFEPRQLLTSDGFFQELFRECSFAHASISI